MNDKTVVVRINTDKSRGERDDSTVVSEVRDANGVSGVVKTAADSSSVGSVGANFELVFSKRKIKFLNSGVKM